MAKKNFDDAIGHDRKEVMDAFYDDDDTSIQVDKKVDSPTFKKTNRIERKVFSVKTMPWVDKFVDDLIHELDKRGIERTKGQVTETAFKLLHHKLKQDGTNVKIRKELIEGFNSV